MMSLMMPAHLMSRFQIAHSTPHDIEKHISRSAIPTCYGGEREIGYVKPNGEPSDGPVNMNGNGIVGFCFEDLSPITEYFNRTKSKLFVKNMEFPPKTSRRSTSWAVRDSSVNFTLNEESCFSTSIWPTGSFRCR